ncbi:L-arabinokinase [Salix suchowensis]|nr:L-arabinokinase [Salix suchowensis]
MLPESILGETFLEKYIDHSDAVTVIDEKRTYVVRAPAKHPIYENFRVKAFKALLTSTSSDEQLTALGELLYQVYSNSDKTRHFPDETMSAAIGIILKGGNSFDIAVIEIFIVRNLQI